MTCKICGRAPRPNVDTFFLRYQENPETAEVYEPACQECAAWVVHGTVPPPRRH